MAYAVAETVLLSILLLWQLLSSGFIFFTTYRGWIHLGHTTLTAVDIILASLLFTIVNYSYAIYINMNPNWLAPGGLCTFTLLLGSYSSALFSTSLMFLSGDAMMLARNPLLYISRMDSFHLYDKIVSPYLLAALISVCLLAPTATLGVNPSGVCVIQPHNTYFGYYFGLPLGHYITPALFIVGFTIASMLFARRTFKSRPQVPGGDHIDREWVLSHTTPIWFLVGVWVILASCSSANAFLKMSNSYGGEPLSLDGTHRVGEWTLDNQRGTLELITTWFRRIFITLLPVWWMLANPDARLLTLFTLGKRQKTISSSLVTITSVL